MKVDCIAKGLYSGEEFRTRVIDINYNTHGCDLSYSVFKYIFQAGIYSTDEAHEMSISDLRLSRRMLGTKDYTQVHQEEPWWSSNSSGRDPQPQGDPRNCYDTERRCPQHAAHLGNHAQPHGTLLSSAGAQEYVQEGGGNGY